MNWPAKCKECEDANDPVKLRAEIERLKQRDRDYRDVTSGCPDVLISRELLTKSFDKLYREKALRERVTELEGLCRQLYKAEETKHQQDWTAAIRALEKVGADSVALERPNINYPDRAR